MFEENKINTANITADKIFKWKIPCNQIVPCVVLSEIVGQIEWAQFWRNVKFSHYSNLNCNVVIMRFRSIV